MRYRVSYLMDEIWERAVETALDGQTDYASVRTLTLDGAVKCVHGRLPPPSLFEKFQNLNHLSIANTGVSSLEQFPRLRNLQKLILSDNRIAGGVEYLVEAGLDSLRDLDLSNNRIQSIEDLAPLAQLRLVSLDLYECPVTRVKDYRSRVFGLIKSLKYLDKTDAEGIERPESDDEEDEEEDEEDDDPGSGEIDGEDRPYRNVNGHSAGREGIFDVDEDESDADEEETETVRNGSNRAPHQQSNGFQVNGADDDDEEGDDEEENDSGEEIDEEDGEDDDVVEVHEIEDSDDDEVGVEDDDDDDDEDDDDEEDEEEEVDNEEGDLAEPESTARLTSTEGEIDGHEQGEDEAEEDDNGETGEEELGVEEDGEFDDEEGEEEEEDYGAGYLVQPVVQPEGDDVVASDMDAENEEDLEDEEDVEDEEDQHGQVQVPPSSHHKRKRDSDDDDDDGGDDDEEEDDVVECSKSPKRS